MIKLLSFNTTILILFDETKVGFCYETNEFKFNSST